ncbi:MAG: L,D-transpeptidase [Dysgonamonadaceae bacterium]|jgi:hypothetical protein|nr:L,D-transpeptidase [Dysgonamonadaceae bacterium]
MNKIISTNIFLFLIILFNSCTIENKPTNVTVDDFQPAEIAEIKEKPFSIADIQIEKDLLYDRYTLDDIYPYKDTVRCFQWPKIRELLFFVDSVQLESASGWAVLQNYRNKKGTAALIKKYKRNAYGNIEDDFGVERYQSISLYNTNDSVTPERYARDGSLVKYKGEKGSFAHVEYVWGKSDWLVPQRYLQHVSDSVVFRKVIVVDVTNQNITTIEKQDSIWYVRSKNPATTGLRRPPYQYETPLGLFVFQEKKPKMYYLKDGSTATGGYSPFASRFCNGGYIHGIPVNVPDNANIEYSYTLGTTPRSHMCVRNATSHAEFVYNWIDVLGSLLFVIE